jgi:hypothetical protein
MNMHTRLDSPVPGAGDMQLVPAHVPVERCNCGTLALKWAALQEAAEAVRLLSGHSGIQPHPESRDLAETLLHADQWRQELVREAVEDLLAVMEAGLVALLAIHERGGNPAAAALALSEEFHAAEAAVLALVPISLRASA